MALDLDVCMLPAEALAMDAQCYVVIDALRATTTIATMFAGGLFRLTATDDLERARTLAASSRALLFGEVEGLRPEGFDYGNSPIDAAAANLRGREAVLFTSNGTKALCALAGRGTVITGAPANAGAVAAFLLRFERAALVCAGTEYGTRFALEDFVAAGVIARAVMALAPTTGLDAAALARDYGEAERMGEARHARTLVRIGLAADVAFAQRLDTADVVPLVVGHAPGLAILQAAEAP